jgi:hypothetical protein
MMSNFTNDEFRKFLRRSSDELRLHPTDKVWKNISKNLNERRRRVGFATASFLLLTTLLGYFVVENKDIIKPNASASAEVNNTSDYTSRQSSPKEFSDKRTDSKTGAITSESDANDLSVVKKVPINKQQVAIISQLYPKSLFKEIKNTQVAQLEIPQKKEPFSFSIIDSEPELPTSSTEENIVSVSDPSDKLLTIESVTNTYKSVAKKKQLSFQVFFTPTVSYRKLTENKSYLRSIPQSNAGINYAVLYDVNDAVTHKPDMGLELGFAAKYPISKNLKLRGGIQFNMSRYDIKAFNYTTEYATIALNNRNGVGYTGSRSNHRNFGGGKEDWLQNIYFQVSAPVGIEIKVEGNKNTSFGVASTIQPGYMLGDRAYLISTDYKNYSEVPWLMRRWNVATSLETFVSYSTGKLNWQVGPQVRYQLLSSFVTEYPVKENIFDFGLKVGVSINKDKKNSDNK